MKRFLSVLSVFALFATTLSSFAQSTPTHLVISQVYGGGGNSGGVYANDFIEIYNPTSSAVNLNGLYVQYASSTGNFSSSTSSTNNFALPNASVQPNSYFLVEAAAGTNTSEPALPAPDAMATGIAISGTTGKVALVSTLLATNGCPLPSASVIDFIGWGTPNCSEGSNPAGTTANGTAVIRNSPSTDTDNNGNDFQVSTPNPHNSGSGASTPPSMMAISAIMGPRSKTAMMLSPYAGKQVMTEGVVTAILPTAFYIQSVTDDGDPTTPEGIEIYTSSKPSSSITIGALVQVAGTIATFPSATQTHIPATEITGPTITPIGTAQLPAPVALMAADLAPNGTIYQLTPYEGMRVSFASLTAISGTDGSLTESSETYKSYGEFYAVVTGVNRPFRQPGIDLRDPVVDPSKQTAVFNDTPERLYVDSGYLTGATPIDLSTGAVIPNITGVLDFTNTYDDDYNSPRFFPDPSYSTASITPGMTVQPVAPPNPGEFTVASFNIERFYNTNSSDDLYYVPAGVNGYNGSSNTPTLSNGQTFQSEAVDVTSTAYQNRLKKVSLAVRTVLNSPDIVTIEEVENQSVANDIATQINTDAGVNGLYTGYSTDNSTYFTQDGTGISVGFLVKNTVTVNNVSQFGQATPGAPDLTDQTFTPTSGNLTTLNDRPWLVLDAGIKRTGGSDYPVTVIVNHMKALSGVNSPTNNSTRLKKELQAEDIAKYIQTLQAAGKHVISGGDFNAYEFSDGYTDTLATYTNTNVLPAVQVVQPGVPGLVTPPLVDMALNLQASDRWSYVEFGNAQVLDHMVVTPELANGRIAYAHIDADFPVIDYNDATTPARTSDHDPVIGYFTLPAVVGPQPAAPSLSATSLSFPGTPVKASAATQTVTLTNNALNAIPVTFAITGDYTQTNTCNGNVPATGNCTVTVIFTPTTTGTRTGTLTVSTPNAVPASQTVSLTGTGQPADFTITGPNGSTSITQTVNAGDTTSVVLTFSPNSGSFIVTLSCSGPVPAPAGVTCTVPTAPFTVGGTPSTQTITIKTTSRVASSGFAMLSGQRTPWIASIFFGLMGMLMLLVGRSRRLGQYSVRLTGLLVMMLAVCLPAIGCSNNSNSGTGSTSTNPNGTPAATYTYTVTASASNGTTHTQNIVLTVN